MESATPLDSELQAVENREQVAEDGWWLGLVKKSFRNYWQQTSVERLCRKHAGRDTDFVVRKLTSSAARRAALLGALFSILITSDALASLVTLPVLPANIAIAIVAALAEAVLLTRSRIRLICRIAKVYDVQLNPEAPEDVLTVLTLAVGKAAPKSTFRAGLKLGGDIAKNKVGAYVTDRTSILLRSLAKKMGLRILETSLLKYSIPIAALAISLIWNYRSMKSLSKTAKLHFSSLRALADGTNSV